MVFWRAMDKREARRRYWKRRYLVNSPGEWVWSLGTFAVLAVSVAHWNPAFFPWLMGIYLALLILHLL